VVSGQARLLAGPRRSVFDDLSDLSDSPASYLAVFALVALDAVFPVAPSETVLVTGGILIERADLIAPLFLLAAAGGAVLGDTILFGIGTRAGPGLRAKLFSSERALERLRVAERLVHERTWLLIVSDFVPGGRRPRCSPPARSALPAPRLALAIGVAAEAIYRFRRRSPRSR
jgi:membrane protein DedA with SNARE-associated domain